MINGGGGKVVTGHMWEGVHSFPDSIFVTIYSAYKAGTNTPFLKDMLPNL